MSFGTAPFRTTDLLSTSTCQALDRHIAQALRQRSGSGANLRHAVRLAVREMTMRGASTEVIGSLLTRRVTEHPQLYRWDRVSIVTGLSASAVLTRQILAWAEPEPDTVGVESNT
jgi:hypothetical protein